MSRIQRIRRLVGAVAGPAGLAAVIPMTPGLLVTGGPASAAAAPLPSSGCHLSQQPSGTEVAVCPTSSTSTVTCSLIPLSAAPFSYPRRPATPRGQQWAVIDCPGPYPFGGVTLMPDGHRRLQVLIKTQEHRRRPGSHNA